MFTKILLTVAVVAIVWFGFKFLQRVTDERRRRDEAVARAASRPGTREPAGSGAVQDLVKCPACGTWQGGRGASSCGRPDCPY